MRGDRIYEKKNERGHLFGLVSFAGQMAHDHSQNKCVRYNVFCFYFWFELHSNAGKRPHLIVDALTTSTAIVILPIDSLNNAKQIFSWSIEINHCWLKRWPCDADTIDWLKRVSRKINNLTV